MARDKTLSAAGDAANPAQDPDRDSGLTRPAVDSKPTGVVVVEEEEGEEEASIAAVPIKAELQ